MRPPLANGIFFSTTKRPFQLCAGGPGGRYQRGSAMVELPFVVLGTVLLLMIVADLGRITSWAQQVAYSADAAAQFAYQEYDQETVEAQLGVDEETEVECFTDVEATVCDEPRDQAMNAVLGLDLDDDDINVRYFWKCRAVNYDGTDLTVRYSDDVSKNADCTAETCGGETCVDDAFNPLLFIEVEVTDTFAPFTSFIDGFLPSSLATRSFAIRRQIFPE